MWRRETKMEHERARPFFFKIMFQTLNSERVRIPPAFRKTLLGDLSDEATLEGPSGFFWKVKVNVSGSEIYLEDGWPKFKTDHSLGNSEFLLFRYDGNMCFRVQIFDPDGCERLEYGVESEPVDVKRKQYGLRKHKTQPKPSNHSAGVNCERTISVLDTEAKPLKAGASRAQREAESFSSPNPWDKVSLCKTYVESGFLHLHRSFSRSHLPGQKSNVVLHSPAGKSFEVKYIPPGDMPIPKLSKGWLRFARENNLNEGDVCILEVLGEKDIQVHIFRN